MDLKYCLSDQSIRAWCLYDVGNSGFATTVMAVLFPLFFHAHLATDLSDSSTALAWSLASALSLLLAALTGPLAGTWTDLRGNHRKALIFSSLMGALLTGLLGILPEDRWLLGLTCYTVASLAFALGNVFYDAFLPSLVPEEHRGYVSSAGFALGYLGGGFLLMVHVLILKILPLQPAYRLVFGSVGLWWALFSIPLYRHAPPMVSAEPVGSSLKHLTLRLREVRQTPKILRFLLAYWLYSDGIGTIMKMGVLYGSLLGIGKFHLLGALLITQFIGIPCSLGFGRLGQRWGDKKALFLGLTGYIMLVVWAYFLKENWQFWILAAGVGTVQGGTQALSRSFFSKLVPPEKTAEFFGFYQLSGRLAGLGGPLIFGLAAHWTGSVRSGVPFLALFFLAGMAILRSIDTGCQNQTGQKG